MQRKASAAWSLLGQQGVAVGLHLLQTFAQVVVVHLQLIDPVQSRAELQRDGGHHFNLCPRPPRKTDALSGR